MNKLVKYFIHNWLSIIPIILSIIFVGSMIDRNFYFGGDLMYPINPQNSILRSIFLWEGYNGGVSFFNYLLIFWQGFFYILTLIKIPIDVVIKIFIITIYSLGFIFSYLLFKNLFKDIVWGTKKFALLFALLFLLNPAAILVVVGTWELYAVPICAYFFIKYLDTKNVLYIIPFAFFINLSFFPGLPQAKPLIVFAIALFFILIIYIFLRRISVKSVIFPLVVVSVITFLLNAFVVFPFLNDSFGDRGFYSYFTSEVITYNGDADLYSAAIPFTTRFYNSNLVDKNSDLGHFLANPFFITWTFFILLLGVSSVFFAEDKKSKQIVYLSLFTFILFIFIAKGANPPFGEIYRWSLNHIPLAKLFRTSSTSIIGAVFSFTLLTTVSLYYLSKKSKLVLPIIVLLHIVSLHGIYLGYKLENPYNFFQKGITIPNEYFTMGKVLDNLSKDGKILILPFNDGYIGKSWGYSGQSFMPWITRKPVISSYLSAVENVDSLPFNELCSFISHYNISYLLQEKDTRGADIKKDIDLQGKYLMENSYFKLQEANSSCYLPSIYNPKDVIYFNGPVQNITNLSYLPSYTNNSIIFTPEMTIKKTRDENILVDHASKYVLELTPNNLDYYSTQKKYWNFVLGKNTFIGDVIYPFVRFQPDSIFYPLTIWKENYSLRKHTLMNRVTLDLELFFASKRIKEISKWGVGSPSWYKTQNLFKFYMEKAIKTAALSDKKAENLEITYEYLQGFKQAINKSITLSVFWNKEKIDSWTEVFNILEKQIQEANVIPDFNNFSYTISAPKTGEYDGYILLDDGRTVQDSLLSMNVITDKNKSQTFLAKDIINKKVTELGKIHFSSQNSQIEVQLSNKQNIIDTSRWSAIGEKTAVSIDSKGIFFSQNMKNVFQGIYNSPIISQEIQGWIPGAKYVLTIRHKEQEGANLRVRLEEGKQEYVYRTNSWTSIRNDIFSDNYVNSRANGGTFKAIVTADKNATSARIYLMGVDGEVQVENITLERIFIPKIYFTHSNTDRTDQAQEASVTFTKVDPTKYTVTINNLTSPTFLTLSETFDKGWKMYRNDNVYIPNSNHFFVNGFANTWLVNPENAKNNGAIHYTIEYVPQRFFYFGIIISTLTLFVSSAFGLYLFYRRKYTK